MSTKFLALVLALATAGCGRENEAEPMKTVGGEIGTNSDDTEETAERSNGAAGPRGGGRGGGDGIGNAGGTPDEPDNGQMAITGILTDEGVECPAIRGRNGQLYTLAGDTGGFETGDAVRVTGFQAEVSFCQQGTTIKVERIERAP